MLKTRVLVRVWFRGIANAIKKFFRTRQLSELHTDIRGSFIKFFRSREIAKIMAISHAQELKQFPVNEWPIIMERQAHEIAAALQGRYPIVERRSWAFPWLPESLHRLNVPIIKNTPYNLRRFSETPIVRHAINLIKNTVVSLKWKLVPGEDVDHDEEIEQQIRIGRYVLKHPNDDDSFRTLMEAVVEDVIVGGYGAIEPQITPDYRRPIKMWPVDGSTIRIYADWLESQPDRPRYAQMTGLRGERGMVQFLDDELLYIRDNIRTNTPFGLGCVEICFNIINALLGVQDMASKAGADQVHKSWLWWENTESDGNLQQVLRHLYHETEGQAKISIISGMKTPEVVDVQAVTPEDLLLPWQEMLIRIIATGFNLSAMALGLERDVNRNTSETMATSDFKNAVVPMARRIEETITRKIFHKLLDWKGIEFQYIGLDNPDVLVMAQIFQRLYGMNSATPDEIRENFGYDPLESGLGRLTQLEAMVLIQSATAKATAASGAAGGGPVPPPTMKPVTAPSGGFITGSAFKPKQVAQMTPDEIKKHQQAGNLPEDTNELADSMEENEPGILETLSEQLQEFFKYAEKHDDELNVKPAKITPKQRDMQEGLFKEFQDRISKDRLDRLAWKKTKSSQRKREAALITRRNK